jgi:PAS domain S-box-containing protein
VALFAVMIMVVFAVVIWWSAASLNESDRRRERAEEALQGSAEQVRDLYNRAPCGYHSLDSTGVVIAMNQTELSWLGYAPEEVLGKKQFQDLLTPKSRAEFELRFPKFKETGEVRDLEFDLVRKNGTRLPVLLNATAIKDDAGHYLSSRSTVFDITERKRVEQERDQFFNMSRDLFCICGFDGVFRAANPSWEKTLGYLPGQLVGQTSSRFVHPEDQADTDRQLVSLRNGGEVTAFQNRWRSTDGSYRWLLWSATSLCEGEVIYATAKDVTEQRRSEDEIRRLNERLQLRARELEAANQELEAFSYSVSHDLRAPLRHIDGFVDLLTRSSDAVLPEKGRRYLSIISDSARQMGQLIDDLLVFSRMGRVELQSTRIGLDDIVREVVDSMRFAISARDIVWKIHPLPEANADPAMLRQVVRNLLENAVKYTRPRASAIIEVGCAADTADESVIFVRDNGVGFDMNYAHKLFGVFQRLHRSDEFEGTGIGLANVRRIIQRHGGRTWAESVQEQGATFYFSIPKQIRTHEVNECTA